MKQEGKIRNTLLLFSIFLFLVGTASVPNPAMAQTGLVAYYPFNGNANDASGYGYDGTPSGGVSYTADRFGNPNSAVSFDGITGSITTLPLNFAGSQTVSISLWLKANAQAQAPASYYVVFDNSAFGVVHSTYPYPSPGLNEILFGVQSGITPGSAGGYITPGSWYHFVGTYDGTTVKAYINGSLVQQASLSGPMNDPNSPLIFGNLSTSYWSGSLDDVHIYNRALTDTEVAQLYSGEYGLIDRTKWANLEFIRRIEGGALRSEVRSFGSSISNNLTFIDPASVNGIQATVGIRGFLNDGAFPRARIGGFFYNDASGTIHAEIGIGENGSGGLKGYYSVGRCTDPPQCNSYTSLRYAEPYHPVVLSSNYSLSVVYDPSNNQFIFSFPDIPYYVGGLPALNSYTNHPKFIGTRVNAGSSQGGYVDAKFDNVLVKYYSDPANPWVVYDSFDSSTSIDRNKWSDSTLEFVRRQISDGVYGMALRSYGSFANNGLNLVNGQSVKELQADLTVEQLINNPSPNPATPMAALEGDFYNVGGGDPNDPNDQTGDIKALVGIRLGVPSGPYSGQPVGSYNIVKCIAHDCNIPTAEYVLLYYYEDPNTIGLDLGKPHRVSIRYDNTLNTFTFGFDGRLTTPGPSDPGWLVPPLPLYVGPPNAVRMGPLSRIGFFSGLSGEGYVSAQFANIATVIDTDGDGVPDSQDNCPEVYNPDQRVSPCHTPGPGIPGIVCDPNPMCAPPTQLPTGSLGVAPSPDGAIYVDVAVTFKPINGQTTPYVKPDPYNVVLRLFDHSNGTEIFADHVLCGPPCSLPNDLVYVSSPEDYSTTIELTQWFRNLQPGKQYDVAAEYVNYCNDLALNPDGTCPGGDCITGIYQGQQPLNPQSFILTSNKTVAQCPNSSGDVGGTGCPYAEKSIVTLFKVDIRNLPISHEHLSKVGVRVFDRHNADFLAVAGKSNPDWCKYGDIFEANKGSVSTCVTDSNGVCYAGESRKGDYLVIVRFNDLETGETVYMGLPVYAWEFTLSKITVREFPIVKVYKNGVFKNYLGIGMDVVTQ